MTTNIDVAQLRVNKEATPVSFVVGVPASYTLTVFNEGTLATSAPATVTDPLPGSLQLGALPSGCVAVGQQVTCTIPPPLPAGAVVAFVIPVTPTATGSLVNTATVSGGGDPTCPAGAPARCQSTVTTAVGAPQLRISKQASPASFVVNGEASYTLAVVNEGTAATTAVSTVADDVPDSFALGTLPEGCAAALNRVTCTVPPGLTPGHGVSFIIPVTPTATGTFVDTATVSGGGDPGCPLDAARCSASIATAADAPQLRLGKLASPPSFTVGVEGRYVLTVFNEGTAATTAATTVVDTVPGAFTLGRDAERLRGDGAGGAVHAPGRAGAGRGGGVRDSGDTDRDGLLRERRHAERWRRPELPAGRAGPLRRHDHYGRRRAAAPGRQAGGAGELRRRRAEPTM